MGQQRRQVSALVDKIPGLRNSVPICCGIRYNDRPRNACNGSYSIDYGCSRNRPASSKRRQLRSDGAIDNDLHDRGAMTFIYDGMTDVDWPSGLAFMVINAIRHKHLPNDTITKVELRHMLNGIKMKKTEDPVVLFNQIAAVKVGYNRPGAPVEESEFIAILIAQAPDAYQGVLTSEQLRQGTGLTLEHLATAMDMRWQAMGGGPSADGSDAGEIALVSFSGMCFICKQKGHRAFQCSNRSPATSGPAQQGGTKPKCAHCHK
jgi:hypothetical protein